MPFTVNRLQTYAVDSHGSASHRVARFNVRTLRTQNIADFVATATKLALLGDSDTDKANQWSRMDKLMPNVPTELPAVRAESGSESAQIYYPRLLSMTFKSA